MGGPIEFTPTESLLSNLFGRDDSKRLIDLLLKQNVFDLKTNFEGLTLISAASRGGHIEIIDYLYPMLTHTTLYFCFCSMNQFQYIDLD